MLPIFGMNLHFWRAINRWIFTYPSIAFAIVCNPPEILEIFIRDQIYFPGIPSVTHLSEPEECVPGEWLRKLWNLNLVYLEKTTPLNWRKSLDAGTAVSKRRSDAEHGDGSCGDEFGHLRPYLRMVNNN